MGTAAGSAPPPRSDGAWHEVVPYSSPEHLVEQVVPHVAAAVSDGDPVVAVLAQAAGEHLRDVLGADAAGVDFQDPLEVHNVPAFTVAVRWARTCRQIMSEDGRALVVGQQLDDLPGCGPRHWARLDIGLDVTTAGLPVTVLCPVAQDTPRLPGALAIHPLVATPEGSQRIADYRPPEQAIVDHPPPPAPDMGAPVAELAFSRGNLGELRRLVADFSGDAGLPPERVADVVLAVNELATNSVEHGPGSGSLRLWHRDGVIAEVSDTGRMAVPFPGMRLPPPAGARGRGLWLATELSDTLQVWDMPHGTVIRAQTSG